MGFIDDAGLLEQAHGLVKSGYGRYLRELVEERDEERDAQ